MATTYIDGSAAVDGDGLSDSSPRNKLDSAVPMNSGADTIRLKRGSTIEWRRTTNQGLANGCQVAFESYGDASAPRPVVTRTEDGYNTENQCTSGLWKWTDIEIRSRRSNAGNAIYAQRGVAVQCNRVFVTADNGCAWQNAFAVGGDSSYIKRCEARDTYLINGVIWGYSSLPSPNDTETSDCVITGGVDCVSLHDGNSAGYRNRVLRNYLTGGSENCVDVVGPSAGNCFIDTLIAGNVIGGSYEKQLTIGLHSSGAMIFGNLIDGLLDTRYRTIDSPQQRGVSIDGAGALFEGNIVRNLVGGAVARCIAFQSTATGAICRRNVFQIASDSLAGQYGVVLASGSSGTFTRNVVLNEKDNNGNAWLAYLGASGWSIDNNRYWQAGAGVAYGWRYGADTYTTLSGWQAAASCDATSAYGDPSIDAWGRTSDKLERGAPLAYAGRVVAM